MNTLYVREASGYREATAADVLARAQGLISQRFRKGSPVLTEPARTFDFLRLHLGAREYEVFGALYLDARHRLIAVEHLFRGTVSGSAVHPREVIKQTLHHNASALVAFHNHPSGAATPSQADEIITNRLKQALALIEVRLLDHIIVADPMFSFAESGLL